MALKSDTNSDVNKQIELPSLVDMVFLLLIFFITTLTLSSGGDPKETSPEQQKQFQLPQASGRMAPTERGELSTLLLQIGHEIKGDSLGSKVLHILLPDPVSTISETEAMSRVKQELAQEQPDSSHCAVFPGNLLDISFDDLENYRAFRLMAAAIDSYRTANFVVPSYDNTIEVRADKRTEFKIINFILTKCSEPDSLIPKVTFRVMAPEESE